MGARRGHTAGSPCQSISAPEALSTTLASSAPRLSTSTRKNSFSTVYRIFFGSFQWEDFVAISIIHFAPKAKRNGPPPR